MTHSRNIISLTQTASKSPLITSSPRITNSASGKLATISSSSFLRPISSLQQQQQHNNFHTYNASQYQKKRNPPTLAHPKIRQKRNREHLNRLIKAMQRYVATQRWEECTQVWNRILELNYLDINENAVNEYMKALVHQRNFPEVERIWDTYYGKDLLTEDEEQQEELQTDVTRSVPLPSSSTLKPTRRSFNVLLHSFAEQGRVEELKKTIDIMKNKHKLDPNEISYTNLVKAIRNSGKEEEAWETYKEIFISNPSQITSPDAKNKLIPMATTTKVLLDMRGDEALPLLQMWAKNREIPQVMVEYFCQQLRLQEALEVFGEYFECPHFSSRSSMTKKKHFPMIGLYNSLVDCVLNCYEKDQEDESISDEQLDQYLETGYNLYNSFMENATARMTTELANKFLFIFVESGRTNEAFLQIYRRFFVPEKAISRRTLIKVNMPTYSETRGQLLTPDMETFALVVKGAEDEELVDLANTVRHEMQHYMKQKKEQKHGDRQEEELV